MAQTKDQFTEQNQQQALITAYKQRLPLPDHENNINHLYLDSQGHVTVGMGHLVKRRENPIPDDATLRAMPFYFMDSTGKKQQASAAQIRAAIETLEKQGATNGYNYKANHYEHSSNLRLKPEAIDILATHDIHTHLLQLNKVFPKLYSYPFPAQQALLDIQYNTGHIETSFPLLTAAATREDWNEVMNQCHRGQISEERNKWTMDLFAQAAALTRTPTATIQASSTTPYTTLEELQNTRRSLQEEKAKTQQLLKENTTTKKEALLKNQRSHKEQKTNYDKKMVKYSSDDNQYKREREKFDAWENKFNTTQSDHTQHSDEYNASLQAKNHMLSHPQIINGRKFFNKDSAPPEVLKEIDQKYGKKRNPPINEVVAIWNKYLENKKKTIDSEESWLKKEEPQKNKKSKLEARKKALATRKEALDKEGKKIQDDLKQDDTNQQQLDESTRQLQGLSNELDARISDIDAQITAQQVNSETTHYKHDRQELSIADEELATATPSKSWDTSDVYSVDRIAPEPVMHQELPQVSAASRSSTPWYTPTFLWSLGRAAFSTLSSFFAKSNSKSPTIMLPTPSISHALIPPATPSLPIAPRLSALDTKQTKQEQPRAHARTAPSLSSTATTLSRPTLSLDDWLIVFTYLSFYIRKFSPITLPRNQVHQLSDQEIANLEACQQKINECYQIIDTQQTSRAGRSGFFQDKFASAYRQLDDLNYGIEQYLEVGAASSNQLSTISDALNRIIAIIRNLAEKNKSLKHLHIKEKRVIRHNAHMGKTMAGLVQVDMRTGELTEKFVEAKELIPRARTDNEALGSFSPFWRQPNIPTATLPLEAESNTLELPQPIHKH